MSCYDLLLLHIPLAASHPLRIVPIRTIDSSWRDRGIQQQQLQQQQQQRLQERQQQQRQQQQLREQNRSEQQKQQQQEDDYGDDSSMAAEQQRIQAAEMAAYHKRLASLPLPEAQRLTQIDLKHSDTHVTAQVGHPAYLKCAVNNLGDQLVSFTLLSTCVTLLRLLYSSYMQFLIVHVPLCFHNE